MQLKMVGSGANELGDGSIVGDRSIGGRSASRGSTGRPSSSRRSRSVTSAARRSRITVTAPPGKLGIILVNKADSKGTVVSGVRTSSVLADKVHPGDRIVAIDGEDVSHMSVSEITTIMSRKSEFERTLTILTTPRHSNMGSDVQDNNTSVSGGMGSPLSPGRVAYTTNTY
jgi:PDZ domain